LKGAITAALLAISSIAAADYPDRPIRIVVPFAAGGGLDGVARSIGNRLNAVWKQPVIVENRVGAGQTIGTAYVAKAPPDGYTLLLALESLAVSPSVYANLAFDPVRDFEPITLVSMTYWILVAGPSVPASNIRELVAYAKQNPGKLNYASTGTGGTGHLSMEMFRQSAGIAMTHVPYQGGAPALTAMLGGQTDLMLLVGNLALPHIRADKLRPIAMTGTVRAKSLPNLPTLAEQSYGGFESGGWTALFAPRGTPRDIVMKLNSEVRKTIDALLANHEPGSFYVEDFQIPQGNTPEEMGAMVRRDVEKWRRIAESINLKPQ
jgi:tripartite-type tricarboxylate transporter receptor subunit TctC